MDKSEFLFKKNASPAMKQQLQEMQLIETEQYNAITAFGEKIKEINFLQSIPSENQTKVLEIMDELINLKLQLIDKTKAYDKKVNEEIKKLRRMDDINNAVVENHFHVKYLVDSYRKIIVLKKEFDSLLQPKQ